MRRLPVTGQIKQREKYHLLTKAEVAAIEAWCEARAALGNQKQFAARVGLSEAIVQVYAAKWRAKQRWRALTAHNFFDQLLAEDS